jgi:hypothetical protein
MILKKTTEKHVKYAQTVLTSLNFGADGRYFLLFRFPGDTSLMDCRATCHPVPQKFSLPHYNPKVSQKPINGRAIGKKDDVTTSNIALPQNEEM